MILSNSHFDSALGYWQDYLPFLQRLAGQTFPNCSQLNALLGKGLCSEAGHNICFVPSDQLHDEPYERRIYNTGQVSTRRNNWHDLFNALVWMRYPAIKTAMNACHFHAWSEQTQAGRGKQRDALTLFDECGVIVFSKHGEILKALAERRWTDAFLHKDFSTDVVISISGHAMLEKYLSPYKSMTAKSLLIQVDEGFDQLTQVEKLANLDIRIARRLVDGELLTKPACLAPLPLAGIPGWWPADEQDNKNFYTDLQVFRPAKEHQAPAPISYFS